MVKKILAIDGGGMYGCVANEVCIEIEKRMGKPLRDIFDIFIGTSTGSLILAASLTGIEQYKLENSEKYVDKEGLLRFSWMKKDKDCKLSSVPSRSLGISAEDIRMTYYTKGQKIFGDNNRNANVEIPIINQLKYPKFSERGLRESINEVMGEYKMGDLEERSFLRWGKKKKYISISAFDMNKGKPHFFRSWDEKYKDMPLREAVMASSSGLLVLPLHKIFYQRNGFYDPKGNTKDREPESSQQANQNIYDLQKINYYPNGKPEVRFYADGGLFAANPANFALGELFSLLKTKGEESILKDEKIVLVSIGTGKQVFSPNAREPYESLFWWAKNIFDTFPVGQIESTEDHLENLRWITKNPSRKDANWIDYYRFDVSLDSLRGKFGDKYRKKAPEIDFEILDEARKVMREELQKEETKKNLHDMQISLLKY
jgi:patatin-like phospholipase/acyl hydrolase